MKSTDKEQTAGRKTLSEDWLAIIIGLGLFVLILLGMIKNIP